MAANPHPQPEFSRPEPVDRLGAGALTKEIAARPEERRALARRLGLLSLDDLRATLRLERAGGKGLVRIIGRLVADVTQACVVTLDPVASRIEEDFTLLYSLDAGIGASREGAVVIEPESEEPPEPIGARGIDLGEAVAQQLALALDPYPRAPGAALPDDLRPETGRTNPFAGLERRKHGN